jgi:hypothetical protein
MKNSSSSRGGLGRVPRRWLVLVLPVLFLGCASTEPQVTDTAQPALPGAVGTPTPTLPAGEEPTTYGVPGADPVSVPVENDGPGATETNFLTPPCGKDSDCGDGRRCVAGGARKTAAGAADGGLDGADGGEDAGASSAPPDDAGTTIGRCQANDAG